MTREESRKKWIANNPEKAREVKRNWARRNPDQSKKWFERQTEERKKEIRDLAKLNPNIPANKKKYRDANKHKMREYYLLHCEKLKLAARTRSQTPEAREKRNREMLIRKETDINFKILKTLRARIGTAVLKYEDFPKTHGACNGKAWRWIAAKGTRRITWMQCRALAKSGVGKAPICVIS
jgi:hypothetical protein